jgi:hypothetical protein
VGWTWHNEWLKYQLKSPLKQSFKVRMKLASATGAGKIEFHIHKQKLALNVPNTGGWQSWRVVELGRLEVDSGINEGLLMFKNPVSPRQAMANIDWIEFTPLQSKRK